MVGERKFGKDDESYKNKLEIDYTRFKKASEDNETLIEEELPLEDLNQINESSTLETNAQEQVPSYSYNKRGSLLYAMSEIASYDTLMYQYVSAKLQAPSFGVSTLTSLFLSDLAYLENPNVQKLVVTDIFYPMVIGRCGE